MFCISVSGTLLLLKREYLWLTIPAARAPLQTALIPSMLDAVEASYAEDELRFVQLNSHALGIHKIFLSERRYAWHDQYGKQLQLWSGNERVEDWILDFHHRFLLGNTVGLNMAGFSGLLIVFVMLAGFYLWWPRRRAWRLGLKIKYGERAEYLRTHSNLGATIIVPLMLLAITGVILVYPSESRFVLQNGFSSTPPALSVSRQAIDSPKWNNTWAEQIGYALEQFPQAQLKWVQPASETSSERVIGLAQRGAWDATGKTSIRFADTNLAVIKDARRQTASVRAVDFSYSLHTGDLHLAYRMLMVLVGLGLSWLCVLGLRSYLSGRRSR